MDLIIKQLKELENNILIWESVNKNVSNSSVGWHIEHSLLSIDYIINALKRSDPNNYKWEFNFRRLFVFKVKKIPRGRAKSPKPDQPKINFNADELKNHLESVTKKLSELVSLNPQNHIEHSVFGKLNLKSSIKFIEIHTKHHIDIINDIVKN